MVPLYPVFKIIRYNLQALNLFLYQLWLILVTDSSFIKGEGKCSTATSSLSSIEQHIIISCVTLSVEMSRSAVWGNLWAQDCNISAEWRKTVFHLIPKLLNNSSRPFEPHHNFTEAAPILWLLFIL